MVVVQRVDEDGVRWAMREFFSFLQTSNLATVVGGHMTFLSIIASALEGSHDIKVSILGVCWYISHMTIM